MNQLQGWILVFSVLRCIVPFGSECIGDEALGFIPFSTPPFNSKDIDWLK